MGYMRFYIVLRVWVWGWGWESKRSNSVYDAKENEQRESEREEQEYVLTMFGANFKKTEQRNGEMKALSVQVTSECSYTS